MPIEILFYTKATNDVIGKHVCLHETPGIFLASPRLRRDRRLRGREYCGRRCEAVSESKNEIKKDGASILQPLPCPHMILSHMLFLSVYNSRFRI